MPLLRGTEEGILPWWIGEGVACQQTNWGVAERNWSLPPWRCRWYFSSPPAAPPVRRQPRWAPHGAQHLEDEHHDIDHFDEFDEVDEFVHNDINQIDNVVNNAEVHQPCVDLDAAGNEQRPFDDVAGARQPCRASGGGARDRSRLLGHARLSGGPPGGRSGNRCRSSSQPPMVDR